jgi:tRNA A-37 threonylcarbamoyl transferase component Bud32
VAFFCINCKSGIEPKFKACPYCGEPITDFLRRYLEEPIDGKYQILSRLGIGGMGEVYKVLHIHLNSVRVIKMMRPTLMTDEGAHDRFVREARLATRINHPNVATLFDFSTLPDGSYYMVWEYIEGTNLTELIRAGGCLSPRYAARISVQALMGLDAIHRAGVVHRDVSPENLMITHDEEGDEHVKIIDLGIAKQWGDTAEDKTKTGMFVGKWKYCSPEHLGMLKEGERIDGRADLYSFGIVLYEMLTGMPPFLADTPHRYLLLHATESAKPLRTTNPAVTASPELEALIFRALEKDREKRFASAREFARALERLVPDLDDTPAIQTITEAEEVSTEERALAPATIIEGGTAVAAGAGGDTVRSTQLTTLEHQVATDPDTVVSERPTAGTVDMAAPDFVGAPATVIEELPASKRRSPLVWGLGAAAALLIIVVAVTLMSRKNDAGAVATSTLEAAAIPALQPGYLGINAYPWGEVINIRELGSGSAVPLNERIVTPAMINLQPGRYEIVISNPAYPEPIAKVVEVKGGSEVVVMAQFATATESSFPDFEGNFR